jgi:mediator of RNA polymerase II transcription subunit 31
MQHEHFNFFEQEHDEERKRFQIELEFVQSLANPNYLNFLAQRGYFSNPTFRNYLKYLEYWKEPDYSKYLVYPQCLSLLEMLQHEQFLKEIVNAQCSKYIDEQLLLLWLHYKKRHDWKRIDPTKMSTSVEKLMQHEASTLMIQDEIETDAAVAAAAAATETSTSTGDNFDDAFSVARFMVNEKF